MTNDVFDGLGVLVEKLDREEFLKVRETLTRVGTQDGEILRQTCFILHKRGEYALMHHLEMRSLDGENALMDEEDLAHRNTVSSLLDQWGLLKVSDPEEIETPRATPGTVTVIPHKDKGRFSLVPYYQIGRNQR